MEVFDKKYCDVKLSLNYDKMLSTPSHFVYDHKTGDLKSSILYLWNNSEYDANIANAISEYKFRFVNDINLKTSKKDYTDGVVSNVQVLHYLGLQTEDFKKLRWFFSAEDFAFYPEKIYRFLDVLDRTSKKFNEKMMYLLKDILLEFQLCVIGMMEGQLGQDGQIFIAQHKSILEVKKESGGKLFI